MEPKRLGFARREVRVVVSDPSCSPVSALWKRVVASYATAEGPVQVDGPTSTASPTFRSGGHGLKPERGGVEDKLVVGDSPAYKEIGQGIDQLPSILPAALFDVLFDESGDGVCAESILRTAEAASFAEQADCHLHNAGEAGLVHHGGKLLGRIEGHPPQRSASIDFLL